MDVGILPAIADTLVPVVDDGHAVPTSGDSPAQSGFGSALASALASARATALGDGGPTRASSPAVTRQATRPDIRPARRGNWDLAEAPVPSGRTEDDTSNPAGAALGYLGLAWPQPVVRPAGMVPVGTIFELEVTPGDLSGLVAEAAPTDATAVTTGPDAVVGLPPMPAIPPDGSRPLNHAGNPLGFDPWNAPAMPGAGLRPGQWLSRLALSGGEPSPTVPARHGWTGNLIAEKPDAVLGAAVPADAPSVVPNTDAPSVVPNTDAPSVVPNTDAPSVVPNTDAPAWHESPVDPAAMYVATVRCAEADPGMLPIGEDAALSSVSSEAEVTTLAEVPDFSQTAPGTGADVVGPRRGMPALVFAALRTPPGQTTTLTAEPRATSPFDGQQSTVGAFDLAQVPGQSLRPEMPTASLAGPSVEPAETATAGSREASRLEAQRQTADAFVSAQRALQYPSTEGTPPIDAQARVAPTLLSDRRPTDDRRWTGGPQEDIAAALADAVRGSGATAEHAGSPGQSTGRDESNGRAFARRPSADALPLYATATRGTTTDPAPERTPFTDAARAPAAPPPAEPTADGAPLTHALVQSLKLQWRQGGGDARLRLQPEYLGELTVSLRVQGSTVTAVLQCDSPSVRSWVETHQEDLRRAMEEQGLSLDTLTVDPEGHPQHQQEGSRQRDPQPRNGRRGAPGQFEAFL